MLASGAQSGQSERVSGRRHLLMAEAAAALRRGAEVEQFLGMTVADNGRRSVRWLTATCSARRYELRLHEVEDDDSDEFLDVTEFSPLDPEECIGEGRGVADSEDPLALLATAGGFGAVDDRWVNSGVVGSEYADARQTQ